MKPLITFILLITFYACNNAKNDEALFIKETEVPGKLFETLTANQTNLHFTNTVVETETENYQSYFFIYNGAGVAVGDLNNDGLADIYFAGNSSNDRLFLNKGGLKFEDITLSSGIDNFKGWSTGVSMVDINADGWLDIYVCRAGPSQDIEKRINRLFINNQDGTFSEQGKEVGLQSTAYSAQSAFFDYDLDGDLDMYLLNHPPKQIGGKLADHMQKVKSGERTTDVFYENVNGKFVVKSKEANLLNFGYRHGIAVGDVNKDGYPDLYISSDSDDPDYFCINQGDKTFKNEVQKAFKHTSFNSMGNEMVDINNDGWLDVFVLDMAPSDHFRSKAYMQSMNVERYQNLVKNGYHQQYMFNTFQLNNGNGTFSEIGQFSGVAKTDWSWSPLFFDMDHDGFRDLFITNGIKENFLYRDINDDARKKHGEGFSLDLNELLEIVPSDISENVFYKNKNGVLFEDTSGTWAEVSAYNSNGVATADFDNDGDLDFVVNNMDHSAILYESLAANGAGGNSVKIELKGEGQNTRALGAKVKVVTSSQSQWQELYPNRGYLSCVDTPLVFGTGEDELVTITVTWPNGKESILKNVASNKTYVMESSQATFSSKMEKAPHTPLLSPMDDLGLTYKHQEDIFNDYYEQILLPHSQSNIGPTIAKGDVDGNGWEDVFIGGAAGQEAMLYLQDDSGNFSKKQGDWIVHKAAEDTGSIFFDFDGDKDLDLYVVSGGAHLEEGHQYYQDRLYENDGAGNFKRRLDLLPKIDMSGQAIAASDIDMDGDIDLFIGGRIIPNRYPEAPSSYFLINENNGFTKQELGVNHLVSSAIFSDYDLDGDPDLFTVGEWSPIQLFTNNGGNFQKALLPSLKETNGLWFSIEENDIDNDGDMDYLVGNLGLNSKFKANSKKEFHIYGYDFDENGTYDIVLSGNYNGKLVPARGRECSSEQMPFITEKFTNYKSFASASLEDIYGEKLNVALHHKAHTLASILLENTGNGSFNIKELPWQSQLAPLTGFEFIDLDENGSTEVLAVGNLYNVEVETERYDASTGVVFNYYDGAFTVIDKSLTGFYTTGDTRDIVALETPKGLLIIVTNNDDMLNVFKLSDKNTKKLTGLLK